MRVLLTGATGFVGGHVAAELHRRGHRVRALVRDARRLGAAREDVAEVVEGDLEGGDLEAACRGQEAVVHVAGLTKTCDPRAYARVNADGAGRLAAAFAPQGGGRFVLVSSSAAAGPCCDGRARCEDDPSAPLSVYGRSKLEGERAVARALDGSRVTIVRPPIVYGERDRDWLVAFRQVASGIFPVVGGRSALAKRYSIVHARDLARGIALAAEVPAAAGRTYFLPGPRDATYGELLDAIESAVGKKARRVPVPLAAGYATAWLVETIARVRRSPSIVSVDKVRELAAPQWTCDGAAARRDLGWAPEIDLREGFARTAQWYRSEGLL